MLNLTLMNHHFEFTCTPEEKERLIEAATMIEDRLDTVSHLKGESKALMIAINLAYDILEMKEESLQYTVHLENQIDEAMHELADKQ